DRGIALGVEGDGALKASGAEGAAARGRRGGTPQHRLLAVAIPQEDAFPEERRGVVGGPEVIAIGDVPLIVEAAGLEVIDAESGPRGKRNRGPQGSEHLEAQERAVLENL